MKTSRIAIQGIRGAFHQEASEIHFGSDISLVECITFRDLVDSVENSSADYGVMAVENSLVGSMLPNYSLIRDSSLSIVGEVYIRIRQNLMALPGQKITDLVEAHSHPMAISQSFEFFRNYPAIRLVESADTALSAREIHEAQKYGIGAIGSAMAAKLYQLEILAPSIETNKENFTRFVVLSPSKQNPPRNGHVKASLAFSAPHVPGGLVTVLIPLGKKGVNLTMLQSLPKVGHSWEYIFHADLVFPTIELANETIETLRTQVGKLWVMGIYPANTEVLHEPDIINS
jgi:prephenate dehydratase